MAVAAPRSAPPPYDRPIGTPGIRETYRKRARRYDLSSRLFYLIGWRYTGWRKIAVRRLGLQPGDTVVEIGCGTGANFPLFEQAIGPEGRIIGVDLTDAMLAEARKRVEKNGWTNVDVVEADASKFTFPQDVSGVLSSYALTLIPAYGQVIQNAHDALRSGGRMVVLDIRMPAWPAWLTKALARLIVPFAGRVYMTDRHPWEAMEEAFGSVDVDVRYAGAMYIATSQKGA